MFIPEYLLFIPPVVDPGTKAGGSTPARFEGPTPRASSSGTKVLSKRVRVNNDLEGPMDLLSIVYIDP